MFKKFSVVLIVTTLLMCMLTPTVAYAASPYDYYMYGIPGYDYPVDLSDLTFEQYIFYRLMVDKLMKQEEERLAAEQAKLEEALKETDPELYKVIVSERVVDKLVKANTVYSTSGKFATLTLNSTNVNNILNDMKTEDNGVITLDITKGTNKDIERVKIQRTALSRMVNSTKATEVKSIRIKFTDGNLVIPKSTMKNIVSQAEETYITFELNEIAESSLNYYQKNKITTTKNCKFVSAWDVNVYIDGYSVKTFGTGNTLSLEVNIPKLVLDSREVNATGISIWAFTSGSNVYTKYEQSRMLVNVDDDNKPTGAFITYTMSNIRRYVAVYDSKDVILGTGTDGLSYGTTINGENTGNVSNGTGTTGTGTGSTGTGSTGTGSGNTSGTTSSVKCSLGNNCPLAKYSDLNVKASNHDALHYVIANKIMGANDINKFGAGDNLNRLDLATALWTMAGKPETSKHVSFVDIAKGTTTENIVQWAINNAILWPKDDGSFGLYDNLTQAEAKRALEKYCDAMEYDWNLAGKANDKIGPIVTRGQFANALYVIECGK